MTWQAAPVYHVGPIAISSVNPGTPLPPEFLLYVLAGFLAQLVDGALGMAYGVTASSLLLSYGVPPAATSATVHAAECFTTGASRLSITISGT